LCSFLYLYPFVVMYFVFFYCVLCAYCGYVFCIYGSVIEFSFFFVFCGYHFCGCFILVK